MKTIVITVIVLSLFVKPFACFYRFGYIIHTYMFINIHIHIHIHIYIYVCPTKGQDYETLGAEIFKFQEQWPSTLGMGMILVPKPARTWEFP